MGERTRVALEVGRRHIPEHQTGLTQMPCGKFGLDARLAREQPVQRSITLVDVHLTQLECVGQGATGGLRQEGTDGRELGTWLEHPRADERQRH